MLKFTLLGLLTAVISYLLGSLNFSIIFTRIFAKKDIREVGSGNAGLTNVVRSTNALTSIFALVGDFCKSIVAAVIANIVFNASEYPGLSVILALWTGFFCIIGHVFPLFFKFKGGKGVLTAAGMLIMLNPSKPIHFVVCIAIFALFAYLTKVVSIGSIITVASFPAVVWAFYEPVQLPTYLYNSRLLSLFYTDQKYFVFIASMAVPFVILLKHFNNLERMLESREKDFSFSRKKAENQVLTPISNEESLSNKLLCIKLSGAVFLASCFIQQLNPLKFRTVFGVPLIKTPAQFGYVGTISNLLAGGQFISKAMTVLFIAATVVEIITVGILLVGVAMTLVKGSLVKKGLRLCKISSVIITVLSSAIIVGTVLFNLGIRVFTQFHFGIRVPVGDVIFLFTAILILKLIKSINKKEFAEK